MLVTRVEFNYRKIVLIISFKKKLTIFEHREFIDFEIDFIFCSSR